MGEVAEHEAERETRDGIRSLGQASELLFAGSGLCLRASQFVRSHTREFLSKRSIERENSLCRSPLSLRLFPVSAQVRKLQPLFSLSARAALERSAGENPRGARGRACSVDEKERNMPLACSAPPSALLEAFRCRFCPTAGKSTLQCAFLGGRKIHRREQGEPEVKSDFHTAATMALDSNPFLPQSPP